MGGPDNKCFEHVFKSLVLACVFNIIIIRTMGAIPSVSHLGTMKYYAGAT